MGLATGKGLASLIREKFGIRWTALIMIVLLIANIGTIAAEFAGVAASFEIFHVSKLFSVPVAVILIYLVVTRGSYKRLEKLFLFSSAFYLVYILSAFLSRPDWGAGLTSLVSPQIKFNNVFLLTLIATVGTTITPWGQFFIQDYVVDKKLTKEDLRIERLDVFFGSFLTNFISFFIIIACAGTLFAHGQHITDAKQAALALQPLAGQFAGLLFGFGLLNASLFGAALVPVATSYVVTEAFGFESGLNFSFREAPEFYGLFAFLLIIGALIVILPFAPLITILFVTQAINAVLLIPVLIFLFLLSNDKKLLNGYANNLVVNIVLGIVLLGISAFSIAYLVTQFIK